jgi:deglycase
MTGALQSRVVACATGPSVLVTSRNPDDLPAFCDTLTEVFAGSP